MKPLGAYRCRKFCECVALGSHLHDRPVRQAGVVHREAIVMLGHGNDVPRSRGFEQLRPVGSVEVLGAEKGNQILVTLRVLTCRKMLFEVLIGTVLLVVHIAWIPFVLGRRYRVDTPVNEDAELRVLVPLRLLVLDERGPVGAVGTVIRLFVGLVEKAITVSGIFADRLLPLAIDLFGGLHVLRRRERI